MWRRQAPEQLQHWDCERPHFRCLHNWSRWETMLIMLLNVLGQQGKQVAHGTTCGTIQRQVLLCTHSKGSEPKHAPSPFPRRKHNMHHCLPGPLAHSHC